ncbi:MAG: porin family protein [Puniceicoccales bacterium]|jgi:hypothetical protein|nr:porin family protein [Puniceicoccales bacterium]
MKTRPRLLPGIAAGLHLCATALHGTTPPPVSHGIPPLRDLPGFTTDSAPAPNYRAEFHAGALYVFDLGSEVRNQTGWGLSVGIMLPLPRDEEYPRWRLKFGGEFLYFTTTGDRHTPGATQHESLDSGMLYLNAGATYSLGSHIELGALVGTGMGGTYGETRANGRVTRRGNWDWSLQIKPYVLVNLTEHLCASLTYRASYIGPVYRTDLIGYKSIDILHQSVEAGLSWRF